MGGERVDCWEFMKCNVYSNCPAYPGPGGSCSTVKGTLDRGGRQGGFMEKFNACKSVCIFNPTLD